MAKRVKGFKEWRREKRHIRKELDLKKRLNMTDIYSLQREQER